MKCKYCIYYHAWKLFWDPGKVEACRNVVMARCAKTDRTHGDMTYSEHEGCPDFERYKVKYARGTVFTNGKYAMAIVTIKPEWYPMCYRVATPQGGGSSKTETDLNAMQLLWKPDTDEE